MIKFNAQFCGRIDLNLSQILGVSRSQISNLIKSGNVFIGEKKCKKAGEMVDEKDEICVEISSSNLDDFTTQRELRNTKNLDENSEQNFSPNLSTNTDIFDIKIIYEDEDLLVLNKPCGLVVHPAPSVKEPTLVDWLKSKNYTLSTLNGEIRAGILHRLDKGTSGAIVVAKSNFAHTNLAFQLSDKTMGRIYLCATDLPLRENTIIERAIGINPKNRLKKAIITNGRYAKSAFANIYNGEFNIIAAKLFTGRTHQIRVHLSSINRHILGDNLYGIKSKFTKIALHAYLLYFIHPRTQKLMKFEANLRENLLNFIDKSPNKEQIYDQISPDNLEFIFKHCDEWVHLN